MGVKKADITIGRLVAMVPSVRKELKKGLSAHKVPSIPQTLNTIAVQQEYDLIIDVRYNGSMLRGVLVDGGAGVNVMTIPAMRYIGLEIERPSSITLKMANKRICKPQGMISNVCINVLGISTAVDFHVVLEEDKSYPMILRRPWLTKSHIRNYGGEGYMTIGKGPNRQRIAFVPLGGAPTSDESDSDSLETDNSESEGIYTDDSSDDEVGLYAIEAVPKGEVPPQRQIPAKRPREKPILSDEDIAWRLNQIRLGAESFPQEREHFRKLLRKFIHLFAFNYKDLREVTLKTHKIDLV